MNQANQQVVIQNANMNLVQIRQFELDYFSNFFSNFGTQAAIMVGFIAGSISQVPGYDDPTGAGYFWEVEYWVTSALCCGTAMACLIAAFFILVFGQGLAIRGKEGAMIQSIEGMIVEQHYIVILFGATLLFFALQCMGMYYLMYDSTSALVTTIITGVAIIQGYREAIRLYNRFYWGHRVTTNFDTRDTQDDLNDLDPSLVNDLMARTRKTKKKKTMEEYGKKRTSLARDMSTSTTMNPMAEKKSVIGDAMEDSSADEMQSVAGTVAGATIRKPQAAPNNASISSNMYGAYLTMRDRGRFGKEDWMRRYFLVKGHLLYYYSDRRTFDLNPSKPINKRAIDLEGYTLVAGSLEPPYPITLIPFASDDIRKVWKFRCDTSGEFERWIQLFSVALANCNPNRKQGELVMIADGKTEVVSAMEDDDDEEEDY